jgi:hypothetical protein
MSGEEHEPNTQKWFAIYVPELLKIFHKIRKYIACYYKAICELLFIKLFQIVLLTVPCCIQFFVSGQIICL